MILAISIITNYHQLLPIITTNMFRLITNINRQRIPVNFRIAQISSSARALNSFNDNEIENAKHNYFRALDKFNRAIIISKTIHSKRLDQIETEINALNNNLIIKNDEAADLLNRQIRKLKKEKIKIEEHESNLGLLREELECATDRYYLAKESLHK